MRKMVLLALASFFYLSSNVLAAGGYSFNLSCPNGGKIVIGCSDIHYLPDEGSGGECTLTYQECSIFPGSLYVGEISIGYSYMPAEGVLWIDFEGGSSFSVSCDNDEFSIYFPSTLSFELQLPSFTPISLSYNGSEPYILINGEEVVITKDILPYLISF